MRSKARDQLIRLSKIKAVSRTLDVDKADTSPVNQSLCRVFVCSPIGLWVSSCQTRNKNHSQLGRCKEYFDLRCYLLRQVTPEDKKALELDFNEQLQAEVDLLLNFSHCGRKEDSAFLAGHIQLMETFVELLSSEDQEQLEKLGRALIPEVVSSFLFPASKLRGENRLRFAAFSKVSLQNERQ